MSRRGPFLTVVIGALAAIGLAMAPACADDPDPEPAVFTEPGTVFEVDVGDEVTIVLESNVTTGYAWALETPPLVDVVRFVDDVYVEPDPDLADPDLVGAGGHQELTFEAVGEGTAELSLWYVRSFDDPKEPADRAVFEIVVS
jgi:predicted secreted protein